MIDLMEKLIETNFEDQFKPISDTEKKRRIAAITRVCYGCKEPLTVDDAAEGYMYYNEMVEEHELEGYVHCRGEEEEFLQELDEPLHRAIKKLGGDPCPGSILTCVDCVDELAESEGIWDEDDVDD